MGIRYVSYRVVLLITKKLGLLKNKFPTKPKQSTFITLADWKDTKAKFLIESREKLNFPKTPNKKLKEETLRILNGEICFFSYDWKNIGLDYNWITNPDTNYEYDIHLHWTDIPDFKKENGDIKYVWEKSRFAFLLKIIRFDYHFEQDNSEFVFTQIESWIDKNPINQGPNWVCSQEISLRTFNWLYALYFYQNSNALTEERFQKIMYVIYWSLQHVYNHINFSRIAVRNNHAITETLFLAISQNLFPFFNESRKWSEIGTKYFEQEIDYQIYKDGTFLQFSMNYHRVVVQLLTFGIALKEIHNQKFSKVVYDKAYKSVQFLFECMQDENGFLPNYGANDGALFFPLNEYDFRNYKPQLNTLHKLLTNENLIVNDDVYDDENWFLSNIKFENNYVPLKRTYGIFSFDFGGYYLARKQNSFTFIRCGKHKDRPSHADNLHLDVWVKGENVLLDSGSYKYNTSEKNSNYFTGTSGHNTVSLNHASQMLKGSRFIWFYWSQAQKAMWQETENEYVFEGIISAFQYLNPKTIHKRKVTVSKNEELWNVVDEVSFANTDSMQQNWHYNSDKIQFHTIELQNDIESYNSSYYGLKEKGEGISFSFNKNITTQIKYVEE
ncbi:alginate lyase family protein [Flavobacterium urocaniciphilum]|uniref:Heparinase II/III N-terminus n=1 Tax=Flavobacterium urocaniciphilum TaxID=1299341 RepID=A0A1H8YRP3_9FLAO|nr:alginate lyase family protein [Flavobacterium urocaniciphilum]SEP54789.1 Heparinase II/III N-terminus [Flavobacterium urocaniciphilum]